MGLGKGKGWFYIVKSTIKIAVGGDLEGCVCSILDVESG